MTKTITLMHGAFVTTETFRRGYQVATVRGLYMVGNGTASGPWEGDPEVQHNQARARGHATAFSSNAGSMLLGDRNAAEQQAKRLQREKAQSVVLKAGQVVKIEGEKFTVRIAGEGYSNPIGFDLVTKK